MEKLLKLLEKNAMLTNEQLGSMLGVSAAEAEQMKRKLLDDGIIKGSSIFYDDGGATVKAIIEISVTPTAGNGFDEIAKSIKSFTQVESLYLSSGNSDLAAIVKASSFREVSDFVAASLSPLDGVIGTKTNFLMTRYKENGFEIERSDGDERVDL
jgi:Transcriptional regulators